MQCCSSWCPAASPIVCCQSCHSEPTDTPRSLCTAISRTAALLYMESMPKRCSNHVQTTCMHVNLSAHCRSCLKMWLGFDLASNGSRCGIGPAGLPCRSHASNSVPTRHITLSRSSCPSLPPALMLNTSQPPCSKQLRPGAESLKGPAAPAAPYRVMDTAASVPASSSHAAARGQRQYGRSTGYGCSKQHEC